MTDTTTRLDLPYPEASDEAEGHLQMQALAEALDALAVAYDIGAAASRPASPTVEALFYIATDTEVVSVWDGDEWYDINPKDAAAGTASLRTLGTSSTSAAAGDDVRLLAGRLAIKTPVRAVHTSNIDETNPGTMTFGGVVCSAGDRVLLAGQSSSAENGIWIVGANSSTTMTRATDMAAGSSIAGGCLVPVSESSTTANVDSVFICTTNDTDIVVGTDPQAWSLAGGADVSMLSRTETVTGAKTMSVAPKHAVQALTATGSISATGGRLVTFTGSSGQTLTLPAAAVGMEFVVQNIDATDNVTVARAGSDTIDGLTTSVTLGPGERCTFRCSASAAWQTERAEAVIASGRRVERVAPLNAVQVLTASGNISASEGKFVTFAGSSGQTLTLPTVVAGMEFTIRNLDATDSVTVAPQAGENIDGMANGVGFTVPAGGVVTVRAFASGAWLTDDRPLTVHHGLKTLQALGSVVKASTTDPSVAHTTGGMGDGWAMFHAIYVPRPMTLTGACFVLTTAMTVPDNSNQLGLYSTDGTTLTRLAVTTTDSTLWQSPGFKQKAFSSPIAVAEGVYYLAALANWNGGVTPALWGVFNGVSNFLTSLDLGNKKGNVVYKTGETSLGASYTHAGLDGNLSGVYFLGVY